MSVNNFSPPLILLDLHVLQNFSNNEKKVQILEVNFIFLTFIKVWTQYVLCKVNMALFGRHFARGTLRSYFDECRYFLNILYLILWPVQTLVSISLVFKEFGTRR